MSIGEQKRRACATAPSPTTIRKEVASLRAAHRARRSEMLRARINDVDSKQGPLPSREKAGQGQAHEPPSGTDAVPCRDVAGLVGDPPRWEFLFCHDLQVFRSKKKRTECEPLTATRQATISSAPLPAASGKVAWLHVFRHSFVSNCAAKNIDQRVIDEWTGHQTEEMRRRYRHLFPHLQQTAIRLVFGDGQ